jgi:hypothetical protein
MKRQTPHLKDSSCRPVYWLRVCISEVASSPLLARRSSPAWDRQLQICGRQLHRIARICISTWIWSMSYEGTDRRKGCHNDSCQPVEHDLSRGSTAHDPTRSVTDAIVLRAGGNEPCWRACCTRKNLELPAWSSEEKRSITATDLEP